MDKENTFGKKNYSAEAHALQKGLKKRANPERIADVLQPTPTRKVPLRPETVAAVVEALEGSVLNGLNEYGLYREAGQSIKIIKLAAEMQAGASTVAFENEEPLDIAAALLRFLRQGVEPAVIPPNCIQSFIDATGDTERMRRVLHEQLSLSSKRTLVIFGLHLIKVRDSEGTGLCSNESIALIVSGALCPESLFANGSDTIVSRTTAKHDALAFFLENLSTVFSDDECHELLHPVKVHTGLTPKSKARLRSAGEQQLIEEKARANIAAAQTAIEQSKLASRRAEKRPGLLRMRSGKRTSSKADVISTPTRVHRIGDGGQIHEIERTRTTKGALLERVVLLEQNQRRLEAELASMKQLLSNISPA